MKKLFYILSFVLFINVTACNEHPLVPINNDIIVDQPFSISEFTYSAIRSNIGGRLAEIPTGQNHITFFRDAVDANNANDKSYFQSFFPILESNFEIELTTEASYKWKDNYVAAYTNINGLESNLISNKFLSPLPKIEMFDPSAHMFFGGITLVDGVTDYPISMDVITSELVFLVGVDGAYINDINNIDIAFQFLEKNRTSYNGDLVVDSNSAMPLVYNLTSIDQLNYIGEKITLPGTVSAITVTFKYDATIVKAVNYAADESFSSNERLEITLPSYSGATVAGGRISTVTFNGVNLVTRSVTIN